MGKRFDPETQKRIDELFNYCYRTAARGEWKHASDWNTYGAHWFHSSGLMLAAKQTDRPRCYQYQPVGDDSLRHALPFTRSQRRALRKALLSAWRIQRQQERDQEIIVALTNLQTKVDAHKFAPLMPPAPTAAPSPIEIETAAKQTKEWVAKGGKQPPNPPAPPTGQKQPPSPPKTSPPKTSGQTAV